MNAPRTIQGADGEYINVDDLRNLMYDIADEIVAVGGANLATIIGADTLRQTGDRFQEQYG